MVMLRLSGNLYNYRSNISIRPFAKHVSNQTEICSTCTLISSKDREIKDKFLRKNVVEMEDVWPSDFQSDWLRLRNRNINTT